MDFGKPDIKNRNTSGTRSAGAEKVRFFLFTTITVPSTSDYAEDLGKIYQMLSQVPAVTESFVQLDEISDDLDQGDSP